MLNSLLFSIAVVAAGWAVLRLLGLSKGIVALGLMPAAGLASLGVVCAWPALLGAPPPTGGGLLLALALAGFCLAVRDRGALREALARGWREQRLALAVLGVALLVPLFAMGVAFAGVGAPLSPHDGAFHTQVIDQLRGGSRWTGSWYPPGTHAVFAAMLQLLPWVDTAQGTFEVALGLSILAPLVVFGVGCAVVHDLRVAALGALLLSLSYLFPYFEQMWSGWPLGMSLLLVLGLWIAASEYAARPAVSWALLAGLLVGAVVLVHGTELYTGGLLLLVVLAAAWRRLAWRRLPGHIALAIGLALVCASPYLPMLLHWAAGGGSSAVGSQEGGVLETGLSGSGVRDLVEGFALNMIGVDLPVRPVLIPAGLWWAVRSGRGRSVAAVALLFGGLTLLFSFGIGLPLVRTVYAVTFPWGMSYRLLMLVGVALALVGGGGAVWLAQALTSRAQTWSPLLRRQSGRVARVLVGSWLVLSGWALTLELHMTATAVNTSSADDAAAMAWLRQHARPGEVVANDWFADAGIWAPYKAGLAVVMPRELPADGTAEQRRLVLEHVADLPSVASAACLLHVGYVYNGAQPPTGGWESRHFPPLDTLRAAPGLEEVFSSGQAVVFRTRLGCDG